MWKLRLKQKTTSDIRRGSVLCFDSVPQILSYCGRVTTRPEGAEGGTGGTTTGIVTVAQLDGVDSRFPDTAVTMNATDEPGVLGMTVLNGPAGGMFCPTTTKVPVHDGALYTRTVVPAVVDGTHWSITGCWAKAGEHNAARRRNLTLSELS